MFLVRLSGLKLCDPSLSVTAGVAGTATVGDSQRLLGCFRQCGRTLRVGFLTAATLGA